MHGINGFFIVIGRVTPLRKKMMHRNSMIKLLCIAQSLVHTFCRHAYDGICHPIDLPLKMCLCFCWVLSPAHRIYSLACWHCLGELLCAHSLTILLFSGMHKSWGVINTTHNIIRPIWQQPWLYSSLMLVIYVESCLLIDYISVKL